MKSLLRLNPYLWRYRRELLAGVVCVLLTNFFMMSAPKFVGRAIDTMSGNFTSSDVLRYVLLALLCSALSGVFMFLVRQFIIVASRKIEYDLKNDFYAHLQRLSPQFFRQSNTGDLMSRATNDLNAVRNYLGPGIMYSLNTVFRLIFALSAMLTVSPMLTLFALLPAPVLSYLVYRMGKAIHEQSQILQAKYGELSTKVQENLAGIRVVKAYAREESDTAAFAALNREYYDQNLKLARLQALFYPSMSALLGLSVMLILWIGGQYVIHGKMTLGDIAQFLVYMTSLAWPLISIGWVTNILQRAAAAQLRLDEVMLTQPDIADKASDEQVSIEGEIEFRQVSFAYPTQPERLVLKNLSFKIPKGCRFAIVGATGSGKSTLVNLLPRLIEPTKGEILIDGRPIQTLPLRSLRRAIGFVPQDHFLFSDTIRHNIAFGVPHASLDEIRKAAWVAAIDEEIERFPAGYDTLIGERGITLSGGQKQRLSIARALLCQPKILILDDSLCAVDTHTEDTILNRLQAATTAMTVILISHRISTVQHADHIIVLDNGELVESGTHDELLAKDGLYAALYRKQLLEEELSTLE
ncbi:MAG: ABC transporter ATP-binding protein [Candidatus Thermochlorobacter aerophilum]|jgi:ATP-binding cassette subfamily B protein|uniref:Multidrug resistance-like ATP-binding protein MdlA n=1 Tax=Candidatus Thermochlorobacter aerophilus TaxID=1868324 RepID=A0A395LZJ6_9BACT|nr:MAG: ABC transporter ATP-binding protein [Candidatus Thermochlorobacter aerophilum]